MGGVAIKEGWTVTLLRAAAWALEHVGSEVLLAQVQTSGEGAAGRSCSEGLDVGQFRVALRLLLAACKATSILAQLQTMLEKRKPVKEHA